MTTLYDQISNANTMLEACRAELSRLGKDKEARQLKGMEVTNPQTALMALQVLTQLSLEGEAEDCRQATMSTLHAVRDSALSLAS